jgi:hypothetical protein
MIAIGSLFPASPAVAAGPQVTLDISRETVDAGAAVTLSAHLVPHQDTSNQTLTLHATPFGETSIEIAAGAVDAAGDLATDYTPERNTTFVATWDGDEDDDPVTSEPGQVLVRVSARCHLSDAYGRSGDFKLFRLRDGAPMVGAVVPKQVGRPLRFVVQKRADGLWRFHEKSSFPMSSDGRVTAYFRPRRAGTFRVRTVFDVPDLVRAESPWRYLKMTGRA